MITPFFYVINGACLFLILLYTIHQYILTFHYFRSKKPISDLKFPFESLPFISIQLPIFNEKYVLDTLFDSISNLDYPKNRLEIQVLDDSTDESKEIVVEKTQELRNLGFDCQYIHRTDRSNFKAGALANGLETAKGEFLAIFDADFMPQKDWLMQVVHSFQDSKVAFVQTRWDYVNRDFSLLSAVQAMALDYHFTIEQVGRNAAGLMFNFNGTAGIWRKSAIIDAGNWQGDTLTEDLDLSIRTQMNSWKSVYLENVATPSELPQTMAAVRSQQFRWNKGGAQNLLKFTGKILSSNLSLFSKINTILHLLNSSVFLFVFLFAITSIPILFISNSGYYMDFLLWPGAILKYNFIFVFFAFYYVHLKCNPSRSFLFFTRNFISFFPYVFAISWHNSLAVLEAYFHKKSDFIRTPKFSKGDFKANAYHKSHFNFKIAMEVFWFLLFGFGILLSFIKHDFSYLGIYLTLCIGFGFIFIKSINE
jgi:cellulose synthase/poly-beta-1,6-N-acetylglucosamine synthase-like glycosyltransferase